MININFISTENPNNKIFVNRETMYALLCSENVTHLAHKGEIMSNYISNVERKPMRILNLYFLPHISQQTA